LGDVSKLYNHSVHFIDKASFITAESRSEIYSLKIRHLNILSEGTWPSSFAVPHRSVTRSPSRPELEAMSRLPLEQVAWPIPQGQVLPTSGDEPSDLDSWGWSYGPRRLCQRQTQGVM